MLCYYSVARSYDAELERDYLKAHRAFTIAEQGAAVIARGEQSHDDLFYFRGHGCFHGCLRPTRSAHDIACE